VAVRVAALSEVVERGLAGGREAVRRRVLELESSADPTEALWAKGALSRIDGDRQRWVEIARTAAATPEWGDPRTIVRALDPESGEALLRAAAAEAARGPSGERSPVAKELVDAFALGGKDAAVAVIGRGIGAVEPEALGAWLLVAGGFRPTPGTLLDALVLRARSDPDGGHRAVLEFLGGPEARLDAMTPTALRFVRERLAARAPGGGPVDPDVYLFAIVRKLPVLDAETARGVLTWVREGNEATATNALIALSALGPRATEAAKGLLEWGESAPAALRPALAATLSAAAPPGVGALAALRLAAGTPEEQRAWLSGLRDVPDAEPLWEPLRALARGDDVRLAGLAAAAAARIDPAGNSPASREILRAALEDPRPDVRLAASRAVPGVTAVDRALWDSVGRLVTEQAKRVTSWDMPAGTPGEVRRETWAARAAIDALVAAAERADASIDVPGALLPMLRGTEGARVQPEARPRVLRLLSDRSPEDPRVRAALLDAMSNPDATFEEREAALAGLGKITTPTAEERRTVRRAGETDLRLKDAADRVLARPGW
jgi:hypothetical protein